MVASWLIVFSEFIWFDDDRSISVFGSEVAAVAGIVGAQFRDLESTITLKSFFTLVLCGGGLVVRRVSS